jgi:hypothetical protein
MDKMLILPATRAGLRIFYIVFELLIFTHLYSCILNREISQSGAWRPPFDWLHAGLPEIN